MEVFNFMGGSKVYERNTKINNRVGLGDIYYFLWPAVYSAGICRSLQIYF